MTTSSGERFIKNNIINFKSKVGVSITIPIYNKVTIITGDSATGKTKMINYLDGLLKDPSEIIEHNIQTGQFVICKNKDDVESYIEKYNAGKITNKILIIDRFDTMSDDDDIIDFIAESQNVFIVCSHKPFEQCGYSTNSMLGLKHDGTEYIAYKLFETPADYMMQKDVLI